MSNPLLAAALTALTNETVITYDDFLAKKLGDGDYLYDVMDQSALHRSHLVGGFVPHQSTEKIQILVKLLTGKRLSLECDSLDTVVDLKAKIAAKEGIPPDQQILVCNNGVKLLDLYRSLSGYNVRNNSSVAVLLRLRGGGCAKALYLKPDQLDSRFDYDFTNEIDQGKSFKRGMFEYKRPYGWNRIALNVLNKYEDDIWLGVARGRTTSTSAIKDEWPVSYHGTAKNNCRSIAEDGFLVSKGKRFMFGGGIYSTPDINVAAFYAKKFTYEGNNYKAVFQNRVNPNGLVSVGKDKTGVGEYWISPKDDDLRPYGICIKKEDVTKGASTKRPN